jgi:hypothetical protein
MRQARLNRIDPMYRALMLAAPFVVGVGCLAQHEGPGASDTATNWLKHCTTDAACGSAGSCIDNVCTAICAPRMPNSCAAFGDAARCAPRANGRDVCVLPCSTSAQCENFREGYVCALGQCRTPEWAESNPPSDGGLTLPDVGPPPAGNDGGASAPETPTLVSILAPDESGYIATAHTVHVLRAVDGMPFDPPIQLTTSPNNGQFLLPPATDGVPITLHVVGVGAANNVASTFDALKLNFDASSDPLLRVQSNGTAALGATVGAYTAWQDRAELMVSVSFVSGGQRVGAVGCAKAFLDDDPSAAQAADLRYVGANRLPTTLERQSATLRGEGRFQFGNITKGAHTLRVSVDDGASFIAEVPVYVPLTREEASSAYKSVHAELDIEVPGPDPTPADCPE